MKALLVYTADDACSSTDFRAEPAQKTTIRYLFRCFEAHHRLVLLNEVLPVLFIKNHKHHRRYK